MMNSTVLIAVGVIVLIQLALQVIALVQLVRTPAERVSIGGRKWAWALIIILGELIGPIAWFVAGRRPETISLPAQPSAEDPSRARASAVDALYGAPRGSASAAGTEPRDDGRSEG